MVLDTGSIRSRTSSRRSYVQGRPWWWRRRGATQEDVEHVRALAAGVQRLARGAYGTSPAVRRQNI